MARRPVKNNRYQCQLSPLQRVIGVLARPNPNLTGAITEMPIKQLAVMRVLRTEQRGRRLAWISTPSIFGLSGEFPADLGWPECLSGGRKDVGRFGADAD